ncbi:MAG TPA: maltotransferase domain-containing protein [Actinocrinis sp.]|nr:maltotransferase domain-containing protein [Actinocrinis sp.]
MAIIDVQPQVLVGGGSGGQRPAKAIPGEEFLVSATVFREGHDGLSADAVLTDPSGKPGRRVALSELEPGTDRYGGLVSADREGEWTFHVEAWSDPLTSWFHVAEVKVPLGLDLPLVFEEGALLFERAAAAPVAAPREPGRPGKLSADRAATPPVRDGMSPVIRPYGGNSRKLLTEIARTLRDGSRDPAERLAAAERPEVAAALAERPLRDLLTLSEPLPLRVDRERALAGAWYEFFPRSEGAVRTATGWRSGTFKTAAARLPAVAAMGFEVLYLPPVHPIGTAYRKGPNNSVTAGPGDLGSPWAIGSSDGGHEAVHPDLGTVADFEEFVLQAGELGLEVALDFALQCSPDHPWVLKHPDWFRARADGTIAYAENPPKKYQDIYPLDFDGPGNLEAITEECERLLRLWMDRGVRIFRVDNPHTKPLQFWDALLGRIHATDPDIVFLAEAFTRPAMLQGLAKIGFHQSYTYFTWRNGKSEIEAYLRELSEQTGAFLRPNFFVNTPDILPGYLQWGGPGAFRVRAVLAATLSPSWGVYAGYELFENQVFKPGGEEYLDSEKYQPRPRDWAGAEARGQSLAPLLTTLNRLRSEHVSLKGLRNLHFHHTDNQAVVSYSKRTGGDVILCVANLDPYHVQEATVSLDLPALGYDWDERVPVRDELTGAVYQWGRDNYIRLDPHDQPAHIFTVI